MSHGVVLRDQALSVLLATACRRAGARCFRDLVEISFVSCCMAGLEVR